MIQQETELEVADNSGAKLVKCIKVLGGTRRRYAYVGDVIVCSVREVGTAGSRKKGEVVKAVVVRTRYYIRRKDGSKLRFESNSCVLLDYKGNPVGTRIFGSIPREVKDRGYMKIASMAPEVI